MYNTFGFFWKIQQQFSTISLMARNIAELEQDIAQINELLAISKRPNNQKVLNNLLITTKAELQTLIPKKVQTQENKTAQKQHVDLTKYTPLTKYSFEEQGNKVKIYFTLENIANECKPDQMSIEFQKQSVTFLLKNYKNNNFIFAIKKLNGEIDKQLCKYVVKTNMIIITLVKKNSKNWGQLNFKEETFSKKQDQKISDDPNASLMNMMKKMYDEGDDQMKKTIAQAWSKSQQEKGKGKNSKDSFSQF